MNFETRLPNGAIAIRTIESTHSPQTAKCEKGHDLRFTTNWLGQSLESCPCGTRRMQTPVIPPVVIEPHLISTEPIARRVRRKVAKTCAYCGDRYLTRQEQPALTCGKRICYRHHRTAIGRPLLNRFGKPYTGVGRHCGRPKKNQPLTPLEQVA